MLQTSVSSSNDNILVLPLPEEYRGKDIEVFIYSKDELITPLQSNKKKPAVTMFDFMGIMSKEDAAQLGLHTEKARKEWGRDFNGYQCNYRDIE